MTTQGGASDFAWIVNVCDSLGPYCLIGGLAVNCYVEPVYTVDADFIVVAQQLSKLAGVLGEQGYRIDEYPHSLNALPSKSELRIQFTKVERYQAFLDRAIPADVLGISVRVAALEDVVQGKLWAYADPQRRLSKRKKDELDLIRLAEAYPALKSNYPPELVAIIDHG